MSTSLDRLRTAIADRYEIERELGHGAMATVFLARDLKHGRQVAVKVMRDDVGFAMGAERFKREIELVTHLSHPHILPIYDSGEVNGELFYVMPYIEGESLRAKLNRERQLSVDEALRITCEVASALDHSHRHGIIHRDIKPENILLEDGQALVADFGIARAASAMGKEKLTSTGVSLGTPTYMSPEQGMADPGVDGRSDIYSLGCVLYEMLAGTPPFTGRTTQAVIARHSLDEVPSLSIVRSSIPEDVEDAVLRALEKVPADRFATGAEFASALQACQQSGMHSVRRTGHRTRQRQRPPQKNWRLIGGLAALALVVVVGAAWAGRSVIFGPRNSAFAGTPGAASFSPQRIAVLYFRDRSSDKSLAYLADGLTESLISDLGQVPALDVVSTSGVKQFVGTDVPRDSIAHALDAGTLVEGSVESAGNRARVTLRLVDGNSGADWKEATVVESLGNPLALKSKLADTLTLMLRKWLGEEIRLRQSRASTTNPMAWSLVQRAAKMRKDADALNQTGNSDGASKMLLAADSLLVQAEALDPKWAEPVVAQGQIAGRQEKLSEQPADAKKWIDAGIAFADRAIALDPRNADAFELRGTLRIQPIARGMVQDERQVADIVRTAEKDLRAAVAINPTQANALYVLSQIEYLNHDAVESHNLAQRAYDADAYLAAAPDILWRLYVTSYDLESFPNAQKSCDQLKERFPKHPWAARCQLWIMTAKGITSDPAEAYRRAEDYTNAAPPQEREYTRREAQIVVADVIGREAEKLGSAGDQAGRAALLDSARRVLVRARADRTIDPRGELVGYEAFVRAQLGDKKEAVDLIQKYLTDHPEHRAGFSKANPWWWRPLQDDARFKSLIATG
jgi:serine/threonine-protein kinase